MPATHARTVSRRQVAGMARSYNGHGTDRQEDMNMNIPNALRPLWRSRRLWEPLTLALIFLGLVMLMQPLSIWLFGHSFLVILAGTVGFAVAGKLPE